MVRIRRKLGWLAWTGAAISFLIATQWPDPVVQLASNLTFFISMLLWLLGLFSTRQNRSTPDNADERPTDAFHIDNILDACIVTHDNGTIVQLNSLASQMFSSLGLELKCHINLADKFNELHEFLIHRQDADQVLQTVLATSGLNYTDRIEFADGRIYERIARHNTETGHRIWFLRDITQAEIAGEDRDMHQALAEEETMRISELAEQLYHAKQELEIQQTELTRLANTDALTGLLNRRSFVEKATGLMFERPEDTGSTASTWMLMCDIDHFKLINDNYGHAAGDDAIRNFAIIMLETTSHESLTARLGGEEFAILIPNATEQQAHLTAEAIRSRASKLNFNHEGALFNLTVSIGVAGQNASDQSIDDLLKRADKALYDAKELGRNQVVVEHGLPTAEAATR